MRWKVFLFRKFEQRKIKKNKSADEVLETLSNFHLLRFSKQTLPNFKAHFLEYPIRKWLYPLIYRIFLDKAVENIT